MLRTFHQLCQPVGTALLVAANDGSAMLTNSGIYAMPWHWHDCLSFILPSHGAVELCHEGRRAGTAESGTSPREHGMALVTDLQASLTRHADQDIALDALEARFGISRRHITRLFREGTGFSIGEFQQRTRYENAYRLLTETDLPIGEIAFRVGFQSGAALARAMRRIGRHSPSDLRAKTARSVKR